MRNIEEILAAAGEEVRKVKLQVDGEMFELEEMLSGRIISGLFNKIQNLPKKLVQESYFLRLCNIFPILCLIQK